MPGKQKICVVINKNIVLKAKTEFVQLPWTWMSIFVMTNFIAKHSVMPLGYAFL